MKNNSYSRFHCVNTLHTHSYTISFVYIQDTILDMTFFIHSFICMHTTFHALAGWRYGYTDKSVVANRQADEREERIQHFMSGYGTVRLFLTKVAFAFSFISLRFPLLSAI